MSRTLSIFVAAILSWALVCPASAKTSPPPKLLKLHASFSDSPFVPRLDTGYRFLSELASNAYSDGDLSKAEALYRQALQEAKAAPPEARLTLTVNLAAVCRDRHEERDAEKLFEAAVGMYRSSLKGRKPLAAYIADHYAALLRREDREQEADALEESAKCDFEPRATRTQLSNSISADGNINLSVDSPLKPSGTKPTDKSAGSSGEFPNVEYEVILEPSDSDWSTNMLERREYKEMAQGPLIMRVDAQYRPLEVYCNIAPNTPLSPYSFNATELLKSKDGKVLEETHWGFVAPCKIEKTVVTGTCQYRPTRVWEDLVIDMPAHGIHETYRNHLCRPE